MILHVATVFICLSLMMIFRRADRANTRIIKLKRFTDNSLKEFKKLVDSESRRYNDSTIEMDLLLKKAHSISGSIRTSIDDLEVRLQGLNSEKLGLKKVEDDLRVVSAAADQVNYQIKYIEGAKSDFGSVVKKVNALNENLRTIEKNNSNMYQSFNESLRTRSRELSEELAGEIKKLKVSVSEKEGVIIAQAQEKIELLTVNFEQSINGMEKGITTAGDAIMQNIRQKLDVLTRSVNNIEETVNTSEKKVYSDLTEAIENAEHEINQIFEKIQNVEISIDQSRTKLIASFEEETNKIRNSMDSLSLHSIAKKDEIVKAARQEADEVRKNVERFNEQYNRFEVNLNTIAQQQMDTIVHEYESISSNFDKFTQKLEMLDEKIAERQRMQAEKNREEFTYMEERLAEIKNEIVTYEKSNKVFERTDEMMRMVETSLEEYNSIYEKAQGESSVIEGFVQDLDQFKDVKRELEKELKVYNAKREKLQNVATDIQALFDIAEDVSSKSEFLEDNAVNIDKVNRRIDALNDTYQHLNRQIKELQDFEKYIENNVASIERVEAIANAIDKRVLSFQTTLEKSETKINKLREYLHGVEESTHVLKTKEHEILHLKEQFNEIDGLSAYMEKRVVQLQEMVRRVENMRSDIDNTDSRLQEMFKESDRRMQQFSEFIQTVEPDNLITKQMKGDFVPGAKSINDGMVRTVRELSNKGWTAMDISRKLLLDENSVRLIINTAAQ
ncbi:MAG: hypothetical protein PF637_00010 [Spirochaetes bacterium]|jgi:chromosome segregation ATPase|nr:hypothetical protein [Spirochaetota bacterium]